MTRGRRPAAMLDAMRGMRSVPLEPRSASDPGGSSRLLLVHSACRDRAFRVPWIWATAWALLDSMLPSCRPAPHSLAAIPPHGRVAEYRIAAPSLSGQSRTVLVYLPPSSYGPPGVPRRYPVCYLLHGGPGSPRDWIARGRLPDLLDHLFARGSVPELIAVMPDAQGPGQLHRSGYVNSYNGRSRMEDFIVHDLVAWA